ncbi:unnamed protein product [Musa acuminata subsp. burmannicoides]
MAVHGNLRSYGTATGSVLERFNPFLLPRKAMVAADILVARACRQDASSIANPSVCLYPGVFLLFDASFARALLFVLSDGVMCSRPDTHLPSSVACRRRKAGGDPAFDWDFGSVLEPGTRSDRAGFGLFYTRIS